MKSTGAAPITAMTRPGSSSRNRTLASRYSFGTIPAGATRPNRFVGSGQTWMYFGTSSYHGATVSITKRARSGLTFRTSYTFSKVLDMNSGLLSGKHQNEPPIILNRYNLKLNKGIASYSIGHQFNT